MKGKFAVLYEVAASLSMSPTQVESVATPGDLIISLSLP